MADSSRSKRRRPKLEPISIAELEADSTMTGLSSIFRIPTTQPALPHMITPASTVDADPESTVDAVQDKSNKPFYNKSLLVVGRSNHEPASTVDFVSESTVDADSASSVDAGLDAPRESAPVTGVAAPYWQTEDGRLFPPSRARRLERAQDALSRPEELIYDILWQPSNLSRDSSRLISIGYDRLSDLSKIAKRNVRHIVQRLIQKGFIAVEREADSHQRTGTLYRVFSYSYIREEQVRKGRLWIIRTGNGVFFAKRVHVPGELPLSVEAGPTSTVDAGTVDFESASTVDFDPASVDAASTVPLLGSYISTKTTSSSLRVPMELIVALRDAGLEPDDEILLRLVAGCFEAAERTTGTGATSDEILYFTGLKLRAIRNAPNVRSPLALLAAVVPKCFEGESFRQFRQERAQRQAEEQLLRDVQQREIEAALEYNRRILADPEAPEDEKRLARLCLGLDE